MAALYYGHRWFASPRYLEFLEQHKKERWFVQALVKSGRFWSVAQAPDKALIFFDRCLAEDLEKAGERPLCLFYKALAHDDLGQRSHALYYYEQFLNDYPENENAVKGRRRLDYLRLGI